MTDIAKLTVKFEAETAKFTKQLEQNNRALEKFRGDVNKKLGFIRQSFATGLGVGLADSIKSALTSIPRFITESLDQADAIQKLNQRLGASTEALSQYKYVADLTGVSFNTLTTGWQRMTRRIAEAATGTGEAKNALAELGLDVQKLNQLAPEDQFEVLADAIQSVKNPADQVRLAMKLFDSEGVALLQTMQGGSEAIRMLRDEADSLGLTLDQQAADAAASANDAMHRLGTTTESLGILFVSEFGPAIADAAQWVGQAIPEAATAAKNALKILAIEINSFLSSAANFAASALDFLTSPLPGTAKPDDAVTRRLRQWSEELRRSAQDFKNTADVARDFFVSNISITPTRRPPPGQTRFGDIALPGGGTPPGGGGGKDKLTDAQRELNKLLEEGRRLTESLLSPQEAYAAQIENLNSLREAGAVSQETYNRAVESYQDQLDQATGVTERFADLQRVIADVDPVAPLLDQLDALEDLKQAYPEYGDIIVEQMFRIQDEIDKVNKGIEEQADKAKDAEAAWQDLGATFESAFEQAIVQGASLRDVLKGIEQDIIKIATRELVTKRVGGMIADFFSPTGTGGSFLSGLFGGARASGGPVSAGSAYLVGERGPELFMPRSSGSILPARQTAQAMRPSVTIVNQISVPQDSAHFRRSARQLADQAVREMRGQGAF